MADDAIAETATTLCHVTCMGIERLHAAGSLVGLAEVELTIAADGAGHGVALLLHGVRIVNEHAGELCIEAPTFRHNGRSFLAVSLPREIMDAITRQVARAYLQLFDTTGPH